MSAWSYLRAHVRQELAGHTAAEGRVWDGRVVGFLLEELPALTVDIRRETVERFDSSMDRHLAELVVGCHVTGWIFTGTEFQSLPGSSTPQALAQAADELAEAVLGRLRPRFLQLFRDVEGVQLLSEFTGYQGRQHMPETRGQRPTAGDELTFQIAFLMDRGGVEAWPDLEAVAIDYGFPGAQDTVALETT